ncbi:MAG: LptF/LptG family permease [Planctomycetes bacterium]|nr:LptF/LptG family permease [Planctomycetota bacterium]
MIATLYKYLGRDLLRTAVLAVAAFTLVMTTFAVIEPLRKQGLQATQALRLFVYLLPVMCSLTLPIAAVFSATFTYGRFSMDNELTACRAGGVSTYSLLIPAAILGLAVGGSTIYLNNELAPKLARRGEQTVKANLQGLLYQKLRTDGFIRFDAWLLHADAVDLDTGRLHGVVAVDGDAENASFYTASTAVVEFLQEGDQTEVRVLAIHPTSGEQQGFMIYETSQWSIGPFPIGQPFREKAAFYDWDELQAIKANPMSSEVVAGKLQHIQRLLLADELYREMADTLNAGQVYELTQAEGGRPQRYRYQFRCSTAWIDRDHHLVLGGSTSDLSDPRPVALDVYTPDGSLHRSFHSRLAHLKVSRPREGAWSVGAGAAQAPLISVTLEDVEVLEADAADMRPSSNRRVNFGELEMPEGIARQRRTVDLETLYNRPEDYPAVLAESEDLREYIETDLRPRVIAEMHGRLAYGVGCLLLVPIGAALGLVYRGGHLLSAFALSCIPAMVLVILMVMGKQMIANPGARDAAGIAAIWGGVVLLGALAAYLYGVALRR